MTKAFDNQEYLTSRQVRERFGGVSQMWLHRKMRDPDVEFPRAVLFGGRRRFWRVGDITDWERAMIEKGTKRTAR